MKSNKIILHSAQKSELILLLFLADEIIVAMQAKNIMLIGWFGLHEWFD